MKLLAVLLVGFLTLEVMTSGQESTDKPAPEFIKGANAVIKDYHVTYYVRSPTSIEKTVTYKVNVLNQAGRDLGVISTNIGRGEKIVRFSGYVRKSDGSESARIRLSDLKDYPAYPDFVFLSDTRVFYYKPVIETYPYTVEFEQTVSLSGMIAFDPWMPVSDEFVACDTASLSITYPADYKIRHMDFNLPRRPVLLNQSDGKNTITWCTGKIVPISVNSFIPPAESFLPCVYVMPESFYYDGNQGNVSDWNDYGKWLWGLQQGRDKISPELRQKIYNLTKDLSDTRTKVEQVYRYLQSNTRYVAVALGIGGLQAAPAEEVARYGYGDCKGLSNFMKSLLESIGIESFYTVIGNGSRQIRFNDFPYFQTNHVILCVPDKRDTIWLECTSSLYRAGYLGYSNSNRKALLVTSSGGILVNTPRADSSNSYTYSNYELVIENTGNTSFRMKSYFTGHDYENLIILRDKKKDLTMRYLYDFLPFKNFNIQTFEMKVDSVVPATLTTVITGQFNKYATLAGRRLIIPLMPYKLFSQVPKMEPDRTIDIYMADHLFRTDTVHILIPEGYKYINPDEVSSFSNEIGNYRQKVSRDGSEILVIRRVSIPARSYPSQLKEKVTEFYRKCHDIESLSLILEKVS